MRPQNPKVIDESGSLDYSFCQVIIRQKDVNALEPYYNKEFNPSDKHSSLYIYVNRNTTMNFICGKLLDIENMILYLVQDF
jgi:hypothetical protein